MKLKVLGVCGGNGVILYPFKKYLIGNVEPRSAFKTPDDIQWKLNFGLIPLFKEYELPAVFEKHVDVIIGAPTCGASSILRLSRAKKMGDGSKDLSLLAFINSISLYKPKFFLFENLTALFKSFPENEFDAALSGYTLIKYNVSVGVFGNSQLGRKRLVIIGIRNDIKWANKKDFKLPKQESLHIKTVKELEAQLIYPNKALFHIREPDNLVITMEKDFKKLNLKQVRDIWNLPENKNRKSWDARTTGKGRMLTLPGVYRLLPHETPRTVLKNHRQFDTKGFMMSPRQLADIQGVSHEFKLYYDENKLGYCLNKARVTVTKSPPFEIGQWFSKRLKKLYLNQSHV